MRYENLELSLMYRAYYLRNFIEDNHPGLLKQKPPKDIAV